jgi:ATP-dependent Clp protease ATP-binding subunit ClpA
VGGVFERYSDRGRQIVVLAQDEARGLGHPFIAAEHVLLGAVRVGAAGDLRADGVRTAVIAGLGRSAGRAPDQIPFRPSAQSALERAREIAGDRQVLPAHVLLALLEDEGVAAVVERCGTRVVHLRGELRRLVADAVSDTRHRVEVRVGEALLGDLGTPRTDLGMLRAILRRDGRVAGWLRTAGIDEAWLREFGG